MGARGRALTCSVSQDFVKKQVHTIRNSYRRGNFLVRTGRTTGVSIVAFLPTSWHRQFTALIDGDFPWGAVTSTHSRYGAAQQHLIVYPPGITPNDRRWLRAWRGLPLWGSVLWFVLHVFLLDLLAPWQAFTLAGGVTVAAGASACVKAAHTRRQVRTLNACVLAGVNDADVLSTHRKFRLLATTLITAHAQYSRGEMSSVDYENIWWHVYDAMATDAQPRGRLKRENREPPRSGRS